MAVREWLNKISYTLLQGNLDQEASEVVRLFLKFEITELTRCMM